MDKIRLELLCMCLGIGAMGIVLSGCSSSKNPFALMYEPIITMSAFLNGDEVYLPGNYNNPNRAYMNGDTLQMFFYTKGYSAGQNPSGDCVRFYVMPCNGDSLTKLSVRNLIVDVSRYQNGNSSYLLVPADSVNTASVGATLDIDVLGNHSGGQIHLTNIYVAPRAEGMAILGSLIISQGEITGNVE